MKEGTENQNLKLVGIFLIGVVVGAFALWMWTATQNQLFTNLAQEEKTNEEVVSEDQVATAVQDFNTAEVKLRNDSIIVKNQASGVMVVIEKAMLEENGWVVIHEGTASHIGNALGAARFDKGEHTGITVELLRMTEQGVTYRAVLYLDNGDKEFNLETDFPFLQNGNQPVLTTFTVE